MLFILKRDEEGFLEVIRIGLAAHFFDNGAEDQVIGIAVVKMLYRLVLHLRFMHRHQADHFFVSQEVLALYFSLSQKKDNKAGPLRWFSSMRIVMPGYGKSG